MVRGLRICFGFGICGDTVELNAQCLSLLPTNRQFSLEPTVRLACIHRKSRLLLSVSLVTECGCRFQCSAMHCTAQQQMLARLTPHQWCRYIICSATRCNVWGTCFCIHYICIPDSKLTCTDRQTDRLTERDRQTDRWAGTQAGKREGWLAQMLLASIRNWLPPPLVHSITQTEANRQISQVLNAGTQ